VLAAISSGGRIPKVRIFISYNHRDEEWATPLAAQLKLAGADVLTN